MVKRNGEILESQLELRVYRQHFPKYTGYFVKRSPANYVPGRLGNEQSETKTMLYGYMDRQVSTTANLEGPYRLRLWS